jgi:hypothetical protein
MADDAFSRRVAAEVNNQSLLNVSYYLQYQAPGVDSYATEMPQVPRVMAEGVYDTKTGYMCMVACQEINGSSDCEVMVTVQFAPMDGNARDRAVGTISSLRKQSDPLFFEALDFVGGGLYRVQRDELRLRMDVEDTMMVVSTVLSIVLIALQLRHAKKHPEAIPVTSVTMLVVLALGHLIPLLLNFENRVMTRREFFFELALSNTTGITMRAITMPAFVLQLRLLQVTLSARRPTGAGRDDDGSSSAAVAAERSTLRVCLPLYFAGAALMQFVNRGDGSAQLLIHATEPMLAEVLASYWRAGPGRVPAPSGDIERVLRGQIEGSLAVVLRRRLTCSTCSGLHGMASTVSPGRSPYSAAQRCWRRCCSCSSGLVVRSCIA